MNRSEREHNLVVIIVLGQFPLHKPRKRKKNVTSNVSTHVWSIK